MTAKLLDGKATAAEIKSELRERVAALRARGVVPKLATVLVGDDPGSKWYVAGKHRDSAEVGIESLRVDLPDTIAEDALLAEIDRLNRDDSVTGYIVQLPLPKHIDENRVLEAVDPVKDADGLHPTNLGRMLLNVSGPIESPLPCTPRAVLDLCLRNGITLDGAHIVVLGRGVTVGRPLGPLATRRSVNATVTLTHTGTRDLDSILKTADVVVAAVGVPHFVRADQLREGVVVLDVGVSREVDEASGKSKVVGDVDPSVAEIASWISPNPGGVGPMTRALLLQNTVEIAERSLVS